MSSSSSALQPAIQLLNLCCSLYLIDDAYNNSHSSVPVSTQTARTNSHCRNVLTVTSHQQWEGVNASDLDPYSRNCIPHVSSCCYLEIIDVQYDAFTNRPHYIYALNQDPRYAYLVPRKSDKCQVTDDENGTIQTGIPDDFDFSQIPFGGDMWVLIEPWEMAVKTSATLPVAIFAIIGNSAVIRVIFKAHLTRSSVNLFILNMSIADLLNALIFPWVFLVWNFYNRYMLGKIICEYNSTVLNALMLTSIFSLCAISFDRLTAVIFPFRRKMSARVAKYVIYCIWIAAAATSAPLIVWREHMERQWEDFLETWCNEYFGDSRLYWLWLISALFWFPLGILVVSYTAIIVKLNLMERKQQGDHARLSQIKAKSKVIWMFFMVLIAFIACWTPFTVVIYVRDRLQLIENSVPVPRWLDHLLFASQYMMIVNSAVNPIIYGFKNENLRRGFRTVVPECCCRCFRRQSKIEVSTIMAGGAGRKLQRYPSSGPTPAENRENILTDAIKNAANLQKDSAFKPRGSAGGSALGETFLQRTRKYYENILFAAPSGFCKEEGASLNSYERRDSALVDLGLPIPTPATTMTTGTTSTSAGVSPTASTACVDQI